jgi:MFS family permease
VPTPTSQARAKGGSTFAYVVLLALGVLDAAGYSVIAPVSPVIARETGAGPGVIGMLVASFPLGIVLGFALAAAGIKRRLTLQVLLFSLALLAIGSLGFVFGQGLGVYFVARLVMGLGSGGVWMGVTFNTLERWPGQEYLCMSRIFAAYSVGGLVGPALGALGGVARPFGVYAGLVLVATMLVLAMKPSQRAAVFDADRAALRLPGFWLSSAGILFAVLALGLVEGILPLHLSASLSQAGIGLLYAGISVVVACSAAVAATFGPRRALTAGLPLVVTGVAAAGAADLVPIWVASLAIVGLGIGLANTGSIGILLENVSTERIVTAMVVWSQVGIVGYLLGPLAGGAVAQTFGFQALGLIPLVAAVPVLILGTRARFAAP